MRLLAATVCVSLAGCQCFVDVTDPSGKPIEGAHLEAVAVMAGGTTDQNGRGAFPAGVKEPTTMVRVSKPGYQTVIADRRGPVVLQPSTRP